jgi:hypothetical protein
MTRNRSDAVVPSQLGKTERQGNRAQAIPYMTHEILMRLFAGIFDLKTNVETQALDHEVNQSLRG